MDTQTGNVWQIRPRFTNEVIGHEYWYEDGVHIGFHGGQIDGGNKLMGKICFDNTDLHEVEFNYITGHIHSQDEKIIVGDGGEYIRLWEFDGKEYGAPKVLCHHGSSMKTQDSHPHPRISPDGKYVLFSSDKCGYINVYLAEIPNDKSVLPDISQFAEE